MQGQKRITIERQEGLPEGDIQRYLNIIRNAVHDSFKLFGGTERYDTYPEVVTPTQVVVENHSAGIFFRADYLVDENDTVSFSNVVEVVRQYIEVEKVERSIIRIEVSPLSIWNGVLR